MSTKTLYEFLGIEPCATPEEIKAAAQYLVKKFHPSKFPGNQRVVARVKKIKQVYNILGNPQKRAAYDAALAKKMAEMAPPPSPKTQKSSLLGRQTVAKKQAKAVPKASLKRKQPVKAVPKPSRQLEKTPQKTLAIDEEKITKNKPATEQKASRPQSHGLNYFLSLFFISLSSYFLFIEPANLRKIVTQVDFLQGKLWCINIGLQAILGLSLLMLLYTVFRQLTQKKKASRDKQNEAIPPPKKTSTPAVAQKQAEATASKASHDLGFDQKRPEATASKASATMPQKTQEAKVSKPSAMTTPLTPDTKLKNAGKIVQGTHIHWLKHIIALLLILIPVYLAFDPRLLKLLQLQSEFWQDKIMYVHWTLLGIFVAGCLIWLHTVFLHIIRLFRKIFHREKKQNDETPVIKKNRPQDNKGIKHETALKKNSTERQAGKKPVSRRYGLAYLIALLLMAMPTYLLFIEPKLLKRIVFQFDFLPERLDRLFYISLSLQALLVLSVLILLITLFQHWRAILKRKALKKVEAAAKMSAVKEQSADDKTLAKASVKQPATMPQQRPPANQQRPETANSANVSKQAIEQRQHKAASLEKKTTVAERQKSAKPTASKRLTTIPPQKTQNSAKAQAVETINNNKANTLATQSQPEEDAKMLADKILYRADIHGIGAVKAILFISVSTYLLLTNPAFLKHYLIQVDFLQEQLQYVNISLLVMVGVGVLMLLHALRHQFTTTLMITSQRIVARFGLLLKKQVDMTHEQFEQINVKQGLLGYILGFGTVKIRGLKGKSVGGFKINISHVASPKQFEKRLMRIIKNSAYHQI